MQRDSGYLHQGESKRLSSGTFSANLVFQGTVPLKTRLGHRLIFKKLNSWKSLILTAQENWEDRIPAYLIDWSILKDDASRKKDRQFQVKVQRRVYLLVFVFFKDQRFYVTATLQSRKTILKKYSNLFVFDWIELHFLTGFHF